MDGGQPHPIDLVHELHTAIYGSSWARPEPPKQVWEMLLRKVRQLAAGQCGECIRRERASVGKLEARTTTLRGALDIVKGLASEEPRQFDSGGDWCGICEGLAAADGVIEHDGQCEYRRSMELLAALGSGDPERNEGAK